MKIKRPKKCPHCQSTRVTVYSKKFHCKNCGYINDEDFHLRDIKNSSLKN